MTKPVYTRDQIIHQLTTSWGGGDTKPHTWYDDPNYSQPMKAGDTLFYSLNPDWSQFVGNANYAGHVQMDAAQTAAARLAFQLWDDLVPFSIQENDTLGPANGQTITVNYSSTVALNETGTQYSGGMAPNGNEAIGNEYIWIDTDWPTNNDPGMAVGAYGFFTNLHEIGHALGLSHPGTYNGSATYAADAVFAQDNREYTIMSYFGYYDTSLNGGKGGWTQDGTMYAPDGGTGGRYFYPQTPMVYDIAAIQAKYGADTTTRATDTTYGFHSTITGTEKAIYDFSMNAHPIFTIWDAGGYNKLDCSGYSGPQTIDLTPGHYSSVDGMTENVAIAFGVTIQEAIGGGGDDTFITGFTTSNYTVDGGAGTNVLDYHWDTTAIKVDVLHGEVFKTGAPIKGVAGGIDTFFNVQDFIGGAVNDTFLGAGQLVSNTFDGGGGTNNKLDYSALTTDLTFDLQAGTVNKGTIVSGNLGIALGTDHFADIQSFISGSGNDTMKGIGDGANYFLDGGNGFDTLDYSLDAGRVKIDLQNGTVDKGGNPAFPWLSLGSDSFIHFEAFKGSAYNDIFVDGPGSHNVNGGAGSDTVELHGWSTDYSLGTYYDFATATLHTTVTPHSAGTGDGALDLVWVEQLHFIDKTVALNSTFFF